MLKNIIQLKYKRTQLNKKFLRNFTIYSITLTIYSNTLKIDFNRFNCILL